MVLGEEVLTYVVTVGERNWNGFMMHGEEDKFCDQWNGSITVGNVDVSEKSGQQV